MSNTIRAKFKRSTIFWVFWMLFAIAGLLLFMIKVLLKAEGKEILPVIAFQLFFATLLCVCILALRDFKYINVNSTKRHLKFYSILAPFGKTIDFNEFAGIIKSTETTINGEIITVHLVSNKMITQFKLSETFYKNFDEIINAIPLKEIKEYDFSFWKYIQLVLTGKIKITNRNASLNN